MTSTTNPPVPSDDANSFQRLAGVLFSPVETFRQIARRPDWIVPLALLVIVAIGSSVLVAPHIDLEPQLREQYEKQGMSEEQVDKALEIVGRIQKFQAVITAIFVPILILVIAGVFLLLLKLFGAETTFRQTFSVTLYAWVPQILKSIISSALIIPRGLVDVRELPSLLKSNLGFLADPIDAPVVFSLLSSLDVFTFWTIALLTIGLSEASKFSRGKTAGFVIGAWIVVVVVKLGFAVLQGGLG